MAKDNSRNMLKKSMTKTALREHDSRNRVRTTFNTGTRTHKSEFDYDRNVSKRETRNQIEESIADNQNFSVLILIGKSASGKDTIQDKLTKEHGYSPIVSTTSRPIRDGEIDGVNYHYVPRDIFEKRIRDGRFIEFRSYDTLVKGKPDTWYYGVEKMTLTGKNVAVLDIDGTRAFIEHYGKDNCNVIYIDADDRIRKERAMMRGSFDETEWNRRLAADVKDFSAERVLNVANSIISNNGNISIDKVIKNVLLTDNLEKERVKPMERQHSLFETAQNMAALRKENRENNIEVYRDGDEYVVSGNFKGTFADLCAAIETQTGGPIEFGELTEDKDPNPDLDIDAEEEER